MGKAPHPTWPSKTLTNTHTHTLAHSYLCMYIFIYMYMCIYIYIYIYLFIFIHVSDWQIFQRCNEVRTSESYRWGCGNRKARWRSSPAGAVSNSPAALPPSKRTVQRKSWSAEPIDSDANCFEQRSLRYRLRRDPSPEFLACLSKLRSIPIGCRVCQGSINRRTPVVRLGAQRKSSLALNCQNDIIQRIPQTISALAQPLQIIILVSESMALSQYCWCGGDAASQSSP